MTPEHCERLLHIFQRRGQFRPFIVELVSGHRIRVAHPEALVLRGGILAYNDPQNRHTLFDSESVCSFFEEPPAAPP